MLPYLAAQGLLSEDPSSYTIQHPVQEYEPAPLSIGGAPDSAHFLTELPYLLGPTNP